MTADACTGGSWDADKAHAAERWTPCCGWRLTPGRTACPMCLAEVEPGTEERWT